MLSLLKELEEIYSQLQKEGQACAEELGLVCPRHCGTCCTSREVEASVFEMMPLAEALITQGKDQQYHDLLSQNPTPEICIFYDPSRKESDLPGCCAIYEKRAALCRLFGVARTKDKYGKARLSICKILKELYPAQVWEINRCEAKMLRAPDMTDWHRIILSLAPPEYATLLPINLALKEALEVLYWKAHFAPYEKVVC